MHQFQNVEFAIPLEIIKWHLYQGQDCEFRPGLKQWTARFVNQDVKIEDVNSGDLNKLVVLSGVTNGHLELKFSQLTLQRSKDNTTLRFYIDDVSTSSSKSMEPMQSSISKDKDIENDFSQSHENNTDVNVSSQKSTDSNSTMHKPDNPQLFKRKRGRPRKDESSKTHSNKSDQILPKTLGSVTTVSLKHTENTGQKISYRLRGHRLDQSIIKAEQGFFDSDGSDDECADTDTEKGYPLNKRMNKENSNRSKLCDSQTRYGKEKIPCKVCNRTFCNIDGVYTHVKRKHSNITHTDYLTELDQQRYSTCNVCQKRFTDKVKHFIHEARDHQSLQNTKCKLCNNEFESSTLLIQHLEEHHRSGEDRQFCCEICEAKFKTKGSLKQHVESVHKKSRTFKCKVCDKLFFTNSQLTRHLMIHGIAVKQKYSCDVCKKEFLHRHNLNKHYETVHTEQGEKWHCSYCGKGFTSKVCMISHVKLLHFNMYPFKCKECSASFLKASLLFEHLLASHGQKVVRIAKQTSQTASFGQNRERMYCSFCSQEFFHKIRLIEHMHSHHADAFPCKCIPCNQGFLKPIFLVKHSFKVHGQVLDVSQITESAVDKAEIMRVIQTKSGINQSMVDSGMEEQTLLVSYFLMFAVMC